MCCFSREVFGVSKTRIFARRTAEDRQVLAYGMSVSAPGDVAMILPLPVPRGTPEAAVRFLDLSGYPDLFEALDEGIRPERLALGGSSRSAPPQALRVHDVGAFEASFVPSPGDFARLDPRFRMPEGAFEQLPGYRDYGFAVFQLKGFEGPKARPGLLAQLSGRASAGKTFHPMAFEFPTRDERRLFFPTVHVHDGAVHKKARFDHALYYQGEPHHYDRVPLEESRAQYLKTSHEYKPRCAPMLSEERGPLSAKHAPSFLHAARHVDAARAAALIRGELPYGRFEMVGTYPNSDCWLELAS